MFADAAKCNCLSPDPGAAVGISVGISVAITLLLAIPVGVVIGLGVARCVWRCGKDPTSEEYQQTMEQLQGAIYEEPPETDIPLRQNQAYGHVDVKRRN